MMAEQYSELEVAPNEHTAPFPEVVDQAAHAPERDLSGESPELDKKSWPPQVCCIAQQVQKVSPKRIRSVDKLKSRASPLPPRPLPTLPLDPTSRTESAILRQNMAPQIRTTIQIKTGKH